ncbi:cytochrome c-type biogenesis protein CcmH [Devosia rhodophyticola]|uniref:Cytochrome c-type biogenesis protein n=1 Tax=Devosia rhodophyticola TaxID=3026423 RepID=A0ABY7YYE5_9HYPH|nr:cytochrome c-type biogenesis protein [Devosia rhodophyticola]WDR06381.1 cytochrome c-type biogenesis protein CcmH [Devosia rhodophyticola]
MNWLRALLVMLLCLPAMSALALNPDEILDNPALEARARDISAEIRCLVCQNQSIDDSDADLARDLRLLVRERLVAGDSDDQVRQYLVDRYGEFVLLRPRMEARTILLWGAAPVLLLIGLIILFIAARRRTPATPQSLTGEEKAVLKALQSDKAKQ